MYLKFLGPTDEWTRTTQLDLSPCAGSGD
jgi:hypothetical protein